MTLISVSPDYYVDQDSTDDQARALIDLPPSSQIPAPLIEHGRDTADLFQTTSTNHPAADTGSDYGDFGTDEEEEINYILSNIPPPIDVAAEPLLVTDIEDYEPPKGVRLPKVLGVEKMSPSWIPQVQRHSPGRPVLDWNGGPSIVENPAGREIRITAERERERSVSAEQQSNTSAPDTRSPLERFRTKPRKALSVTDLVSPAWCELQYHYTLTKHGRKRRTPAMKQGTTVHKALEDEIHTTVPVEITTKEDGWGLRIWNIIQGLRSLRDTGMTRELEVWGVIGGEVVNGIIDELGYLCPDPALESESEKRYKTAIEDKNALPEYQASITDYLVSSAGGDGRLFSELGKDHQTEAALQMPPPPTPAMKRKQEEKRIYITDIKTRRTTTLPDTASIRPTVLQLHLYHHMLSNLALGNFPLSILAERYDLDTTAVFSDSFIAQVGSLNQDFFDAVSEPDPSTTSNIAETGLSDTAAAAANLSSQIASSQDSTELLLKHNHLASLWNLMLTHFRETFLLPPSPSPLAPQTRLSPLLTATYLSASTSEFLGRKSILFSPASLHAYLDDGMKWWRGEREARGVELQEAWKCRSCDFRDGCEWIHERDRTAVEEVRMRKGFRDGGGGAGGGGRGGKSEI